MKNYKDLFSRNIIKNYTNFTLGPLSVLFQPEKITAIIGPNGAGKTTLLHCLCGLRKMDGGEINFPDITEIAIAGIGKLPKFSTPKQISNLYGNRIDKREFLSLLKAFEINLTKRIEEMSEGQKRLVQWAIALSLKNPKAFLLDEPFNNVDILHRETLFLNLNEKITKYKIPALISSHNLLEVDKICDKIYFISKGQIIFEIEKPEKEVVWILSDKKTEKGIKLTNGQFLTPIPRNQKPFGKIVDLQDIFKLIYGEKHEQSN